MSEAGHGVPERTKAGACVTFASRSARGPLPVVPPMIPAMVRTSDDMRALRARLKLSQVDLAAHLGLTVGGLAHIEQGRRRVTEQITRLCWYLEKHGPIPSRALKK